MRPHSAIGNKVPAALPTSGPYGPGRTKAGFYKNPQLPTSLVHALKQGNVVVYYDKPDPDALTVLSRWAAIFQGEWDGVVVAPGPGLGGDIILTAWNKRLRLKSFDFDAAAAFIDAFRGRGPEGRVR